MPGQTFVYRSNILYINNFVRRLASQRRFEYLSESLVQSGL